MLNLIKDIIFTLYFSLVREQLQYIRDRNFKFKIIISGTETKSLG